MIVLRVLVAIAGFLLVIAVLASAVETVVMPSSGFTRMTRLVFAVTHRALIRPGREGRRRRRFLALYAPASLVSLPFVWALCIAVGFTFIYWGFHVGSADGTGNTPGSDTSFATAFILSGSSLLTLGFAKPNGRGPVAFSFFEATIGLGLVALLISYLPTIYAAYNAREKGVKRLQPLMGTPPTAEELLRRLYQFDQLQAQALWTQISDWFIDLEQSHTAFPALSYFQPLTREGSWVSAAGTLLDSVALVISTMGDDVQEMKSMAAFALVLIQGGPALVRVGQAISLPLGEPPRLVDLLRDRAGDGPSVSVRKEEYLEAITALEAAAVVPPSDHERGWQRYQRMRSTYDAALRGLAGLTQASPAPLTTDRPARVGRPRLIGTKPLRVDWSLDS